MQDYEPVEIRGIFRAYSHLPIWEVLVKAGIWEKFGIKMRGMEYLRQWATCTTFR